jgi:hypothetical protein
VEAGEVLAGVEIIAHLRSSRPAARRLGVERDAASQIEVGGRLRRSHSAAGEVFGLTPTDLPIQVFDDNNLALSWSSAG